MQMILSHALQQYYIEMNVKPPDVSFRLWCHYNRMHWDKIVEILRDSNIEDMDLSKVAAKALISF